MQTVSDVGFLRDVTRPLSEQERDEVEAVLNAAHEWAQNRLDWREAVGVGSIPKPGTTEPHSGYTRFVATLYARREDPRRRSLMSFLEFLIRMKGKRIIGGMVYDMADLRETEEVVEDLRRRGVIRTRGGGLE